MSVLTGKKSPFIKKLKTDNHYYIYDVNSNELLRVTKTVYEIIDEIHGHEYLQKNSFKKIAAKYKNSYTIDEIKKGIEMIEQMRKERQYFSSHRPTISSGISSVKQVREALQSGLGQIVLELSERCNQKCRYCIYSGKYLYVRNHGKNDMTIDIATKAVDFFLERADGLPETGKISIIFYGGEPLLRFDLLKATVDYVNDRYKNKNVGFSVTTNGTLLSREKIINYLIDHDIHITVSIDGPLQIHDRYRQFSNNKPTFHRILNNLTNIREYAPQYFSKNVSINALMVPPLDTQAVSNFFYKNDYFNSIKDRIVIGFISKAYTSFFKDYRIENGIQEIKDERVRLLVRFKEALIRGEFNELTLEKEFFLKRFYTIAARHIYPIPKIYAPRGGCFPGKRKLFVDTKGNFYMCEKVNGNYVIGNVYNGFDYKKIFDFFQKYDLMFNECKKCWALRLCDKCFNSIRRGDKLDYGRKEEFCRTNKIAIERDIILFCEIIEKNPEAFTVFKDIFVR